MAVFAVSNIGWHDNNLTTKIVEAENWLEALTKAYPDCYNFSDWLEHISVDDIESAKQEAFNMDMMFNVEPIVLINGAVVCDQ